MPILSVFPTSVIDSKEIRRYIKNRIYLGQNHFVEGEYEGPLRKSYRSSGLNLAVVRDVLKIRENNGIGSCDILEI